MAAASFQLTEQRGKRIFLGQYLEHCSSFLTQHVFLAHSCQVLESDSRNTCTTMPHFWPHPSIIMVDTSESNVNATGFEKKPSIWDLRVILAMCVLSSSGQNLSKSRFRHIHVKPPFCYHRLQRLAVSYKGEINLPFDPPSLYSCHPLLREIIRIRTHGLSRYRLSPISSWPRPLTSHGPGHLWDIELKMECTMLPCQYPHVLQHLKPQ